MIKTIVEGLKWAWKHVQDHQSDNFAIISITLANIPFNEDKKFPHLIIRREDIDEKWRQQSIDHYGGLFDSNDAEAVKEFVSQHIDTVDYFLIHCDAGVSRSRAVAGALEVVFNGNDGEHFKKGVPNITIYREVLRAYGLSNDYSDRKVDKKRPCFICGKSWSLESGRWNMNLGIDRRWHIECDADYKQYIKDEELYKKEER